MINTGRCIVLIGSKQEQLNNIQHKKYYLTTPLIWTEFIYLCINFKNAYCPHPIKVNKCTFVPPQLNQQPDPRPSTTPSHVGHSPAANYATEPSTTHTHTPLTRTVRITRTRLTRTPSSPTGSGTGALTSILSWAPSREAAHPPPRPLRRDPNTPRNCSPTPPSPLRAARGAKAAPRATALRFPQRHRTVRYRHWRRGGRGCRRGGDNKQGSSLRFKRVPHVWSE